MHDETAGRRELPKNPPMCRSGIAAALIAAFAAVGCAATPAPADPAAPRFSRALETIPDGTWEGALHMREPHVSGNPNEAPDRSDAQVRIELDGLAVSVFVVQDGRWQAVMPGQFRVLRQKTNVVIAGIATPSAAPEVWVESWCFLLTARNDDELAVEWSRLVNNHRPNLIDARPTFAMAAYGTLRRTAPAPLPIPE